MLLFLVISYVNWIVFINAYHLSFQETLLKKYIIIIIKFNENYNKYLDVGGDFFLIACRLKQL